MPRFVQLALAQEKNEHFTALLLNTQHQLIRLETLFIGTVDGASVYPRVVVQKALEYNAGAVTFAHNHPSGECEPSTADRQITRRLIDALALIDVRVLDHFVVSRTKHVSFAERLAGDPAYFEPYLILRKSSMAAPVEARSGVTLPPPRPRRMLAGEKPVWLGNSPYAPNYFKSIPVSAIVPS